MIDVLLAREDAMRSRESRSCLRASSGLETSGFRVLMSMRSSIERGSWLRRYLRHGG